MTSRLDRLFTLLENGSSAVTRRAAARQLGEVQRLHPHELHNLLRRISAYIHSSSWETRIAAGQAVEAVVRNVPPWNPQPCAAKIEPGIPPSATLAGRMSFESFDISKVLQNGTYLMGSEGKEYDIEEEVSRGPDVREKLARQRQLLIERLGLDAPNRIGMDIGLDILTTDDFVHVKPEVSNLSRAEESTRKAAVDVIKQEVGLSSREINRARRKARLLAKQKSVEITSTEDVAGCTSEHCHGIDSSEPDKKKIKIEDEGGKYSKIDEIPMGFSESVPDSTGSWGEAVEWPFEGFCDQLSLDLFSPRWEVRHGAATSLREVIRLQGNGAGKAADMKKEEMEESHRLWLEDTGLRLLCVLALDRFGDFVSDQVVAPVRETCAQALGSVLHLMNHKGVHGVLRILLQLLSQREWEARHGALLGLKYLLAVRNDMVNELVPLVFPAVLKGLRDPVEDVGAVAAASLIPVAPAIMSELPDKLPEALSCLWDLLLQHARGHGENEGEEGEADEEEMDELSAGGENREMEECVYASRDLASAASNSFMGLLAALLSLPDSEKHLGPQPLVDVIPRLWPFLAHSSSSVRKATLQTLFTLTGGVNGHSRVLWNVPLLQEALRHVFERALLEPSQIILEMVEQVWGNLVTKSEVETLLLAACPYVSTWLCLAMQPSKLPFDSAHLISGTVRTYHTSVRHSRTGTGVPITRYSSTNIKSELRLFLGGNETIAPAVRENNAVRARCTAARMLGLLSCYVTRPAPGTAISVNDSTEYYAKVVLAPLETLSSIQRTVAALVVAEWARLEQLPHPPSLPPPSTPAPCPQSLSSRLLQCLQESIYFNEIALSFTRLVQEAKDFLATLRHYGISMSSLNIVGISDGGASVGNTDVLTLEQIQCLCGPATHQVLLSHKLKPKVNESLEERRKTLSTAASQTASDLKALSVTTQAVISGAVTMLNVLPEKLNPVVKPLMEAIKREDNDLLQELAALHLTYLVDRCLSRSNPCPNPKIISNLCTLLCSDSEFTPKIMPCPPGEGGCIGNGIESMGDESGRSSRTTTPTNFSLENKYSGILTLINQQRSAERAAFRRTNSTGGRGPGRPPSIPHDVSVEDLMPTDEEEVKQNKLQRRGAVFALKSIASHFGSELPEKMPKLWSLMVDQLKCSVKIPEGDLVWEAPSTITDSAASEIVSNLQVLEITAPVVHSSLRGKLLEVLPHLCFLLHHPYRAVRHMAARCIGVFACLAPGTVVSALVNRVLPSLGAMHCDSHREGAVEAVACLVEALQFNVVPYVVLLIVPLMGRMSDPNQQVRMTATHVFATLVQLMPLDGVPDDKPKSSKESVKDCSKEQDDISSFPADLLAHRDKERSFLQRLFNPSVIENYNVPVPIQAELRSYQQAGVNWLAFLNKYGLHGILCDDMGLGKTLQSICMLAGDHYLREQEYKKTKSIDSVPLPSLVICPPTLIGHWVYEVEKFVSKKYLNPLAYTGPPSEREKLRAKVNRYNLVVASYDIVRKDIEFFGDIQWNYCILDEGHIIKNGKTKSSRAIKQLVASHRVILSGTPIQNNVLELWSLFDFLMPGFLGTEKQFTARYSKPILASRDPKSSPKEQEAGALAMEALHRQVLPFLLRRMKEDVLQDLPPKITQDYYCELSPLQTQLYEDFSRTHAHQSLEETLSEGNAGVKKASSGRTHIFQALRYLQNVCNHPKMVLNRQHPEYDRITQQLRSSGSNLSDVHHAAKLPALMQLLEDCGIGVVPGSGAAGGDLVVNQHRALIFCQLKAMLDILENDLFKTHMPTVTYLRLDGSIPAGVRHSVVARFNSDPSIDVLLLTTQVGGLGLNLTGADTVIFVEHDWNPMKDLQAMDRAHRIGQRKVVNVYRLITRSTLEEKIMGLQKFKLLTANTVISSENASIETMGTDQLLDLFSLKGKPNEENERYKNISQNDKNFSVNSGGQNVKSLLDSLPELWEDKQYEEEYDLSSFIESLRKN
ncbi:TATA-binding protein-associated factor 172 [Ischnura elegans]|uniref:TATA-binding protein-associated factor 172 n=1 Tax=Ischnura elegans TaxID=197161 RepID=UPI001ED887C3|nr:TATA-binding protein-associated factor 172 [Ischnura elegans]